MGQSRPLSVYFRYFLITISIIQIEKKHRWCAWDLNPGPQDGRHRRNHGAMAATQITTLTQSTTSSKPYAGPIFNFTPIAVSDQAILDVNG